MEPMEYSVREIKGSKGVQIKGSDFIAYTLQLNDGPECEILQRPQTLAPQIGDSIYGILSESPYGWKLKRVKAEGAIRSAVSSQGSAPLPNGFKTGGQIAQEQDTRQKMIVRQSCQKVAATLTHIQGQGFDKTRFKELVDWLQADAEGLNPSLADASEVSTADEEIPF